MLYYQCKEGDGSLELVINRIRVPQGAPKPTATGAPKEYGQRIGGAAYQFTESSKKIEKRVDTAPTGCYNIVKR